MCRLIAIEFYFQTLPMDRYWRLGKMSWEVKGAPSITKYLKEIINDYKGTDF